MSGATYTRRVRPYPAYKDSGVEWLGEIPAHWEGKRLKHLESIASGFAPRESYDRFSSEYLVYGSNCLIGVFLPSSCRGERPCTFDNDRLTGHAVDPILVSFRDAISR